MWGTTNGSGGSLVLTTWKYHVEEMPGTLFSSSWGSTTADQIIYHGNSNATAAILSFEGFEDNCVGFTGSIWEYDSGTWCAPNDSRHAVCNNFVSINFRND